MSDVAGIETDGAAKAAVRLTPHVALKRIEVVVNPKSGSVGPKAAADCERLLADYPLEANIVEAGPDQVEAALAAALDSKPDALIVLAGDGTARTAANISGFGGPPIAPLPGGTMNMLPKALYGTTDWKLALERALTEGMLRTVSGGEIDGNRFYVAAILGDPALWAPAREALRQVKLRMAWLYAKRAARKAFSRGIRFRVDTGGTRRSEALALMTPLVSKAMNEPIALEAAFLDVRNAGEAVRLGASSLFKDWRDDASVQTVEALAIRAWSATPIPAILDGEPTLLGREAQVRFIAKAFRALAPARVEALSETKALIGED